MWDGLITWYEATILMIMFASYLTILFLAKTIAHWYNNLTHLYADSTRSTVFIIEESKSYYCMQRDAIFNFYDKHEQWFTYNAVRYLCSNV